MDEIDLIPRDYRDLIWKLRVLKIFGVIFLVLIIISSVAYGALEFVKKGAESEILELSKIQEITSQQRIELNQLQKEKKELDYKWTLLSGLQSAIVAEDLFVVIDNAIKDIDVWFSSVKFQREEVEVNEENVVNTGYFLIVTPENEKESFAIGTKMLITGEAPNHSTLSIFANNLLDQSEILDAKVIETKSNNQRETNSVKFNLEITINLEGNVS